MPRERAVWLADPHCPYTDKRAVGAALAFVRDYAPKWLYWLGDICDFYALSRFSRDPARRLHLQLELDDAHAMLTRFREVAPSARITVLHGNHEARLRKHLWAASPETSMLRSNTVQEQLGVKVLDIDYVEQGMVLRHGTIIKHGSFVRELAGASVQAEMANTGMPVIMGHVHRLAVTGLRLYGKTIYGGEAGCLCSLEPEYMESGQIANWQAGLLYGEVDSSRASFKAAPIRGGKVEA